MGLIFLLFKDPGAFFLVTATLMYAIIFHELAHGWVAYRMGDATAKWMGRLSLNPLKHLDPIGSLALLIIGFGWAKPVPVNFQNLRPQRAGLILVSAAGICANIALAFLAEFCSRYFHVMPDGVWDTTFFYVTRINIMLAAFNLIPIPPLDGSKILMGFLSARNQYSLARLEPYGFFIIIALLYLHVLDPLINLFSGIINFLINALLP